MIKNSKTSRNREIFNMVFTAALAAIIVVLTVLGGYINLFGLVQITIIQIPVFIGAIVLGRKYGLILGFIWGAGSMLRSFIEVIPQNVAFTNPLLSVLPRMAIGYFAAILYEYFRKLISDKTVHTALTMLVATMIHTLIVIPLLYFVAKTGFYFYAASFENIIEGKFFAFLGALIVSNMLLEMAASVIVGTPISLALKQVIANYDKTTDLR